MRLPTSRRTLLWLIAFWLLIGFVFVAATAARAHGHGHSTHTVTAPQHTHVAAASVTDVHDQKEHQHTGDPLADLLTLGHTHAGAPAYASLPPALWGLPVIASGTQPILRWRDRPAGDSPPNNPFRPPIA